MQPTRHLDATETASLICSRQLSSAEAVNDAILRIERLNPLLNAVVLEMFDDARQAAAEADLALAAGARNASPPLGPLHGVPVLIKDLFDFKAGVPSSFGCAATAGFVPDFTSAHIERLERVGAILLGKTNTPEFGHKATTDNSLYGPTSNPYDLARNAGGSSGGSAAAVASGMTPIAQGSDAGGSIRIPAAWCGVVGFKATFGRVPNTGGVNAFGVHTPFVHAGPITRTVRDAALAAQIMFGPHDDDPFSLPDDGVDLLSGLDRDPSELRLAYSADLGVFAVEPEVAQAIQSLLSELRSAGIQVDEVDCRLPASQRQLAELWRREVGLAYADMFAAMAAAGGDPLAEHPDAFPPEVHEMVAYGRRATFLDCRPDDWLRSEIWRAIQGWFAANLEYDGLLTPTVGATAAPNANDGRTLGPPVVNGVEVERTIGWCLTHPFNFTGHPAASVPAGLTPAGLPVGLQVVGRRFDDARVLRICRAVEQVRPWLHLLDAASERLWAATETPRFD